MRRILAGAALAWSMLAGCRDGTVDVALGSLRVVVETTGGDLDEDGYILQIDHTAWGRLSTQGEVTIQGLPAGVHLVGLEDAADNCAVTRPQTALRIEPRATTELEYRVRCDVTGVRVISNTIGLDLDADGYLITIGTLPLPVPTIGAATLGRMSPATYPVRVEGLASNCGLASELPPEGIEVIFRQTATLELDVTCVAATGVVEVRVTATGVDLDERFTVRLSDGASQPQAALAGESTYFNWIGPGTHLVRLEGIAGNCAPAPSDEQPVQVSAGTLWRDTARVVFALNCARASDLAFERWATDPASGLHEPRITLARSDGSMIRGVARGVAPTWSPDGERIAFQAVECYRGWYYYDYCVGVGLALLNIRDGSSIALTRNAADGEPAWSPDGSTIAFVQNGVLFSVAASFGPATPLEGTGTVSQPAWSPDGGLIAFACEVRSGDWDICAVGPNGGTVQRLTQGPDVDSSPSWSPDGSRIVFSRRTPQSQAVLVMNADGTGIAPIATGAEPAWLHGSRILLRALTCLPTGTCPGLASVNPDGTGFSAVTTDLSDANPAWRP